MENFLHRLETAMWFVLYRTPINLDIFPLIVVSILFVIIVALAYGFLHILFMGLSKIEKKELLEADN